MSASCAATHFNFTGTRRDTVIIFTDAETEARRALEACPRLHDKEAPVHCGGEIRWLWKSIPLKCYSWFHPGEKWTGAETAEQSPREVIPLSITRRWETRSVCPAVYNSGTRSFALSTHGYRSIWRAFLPPEVELPLCRLLSVPGGCRGAARSVWWDENGGPGQLAFLTQV